MSLTQAQIKHLQKLTALSGLDSLQISSVVDSFASMDHIDTTHVTSTTRSGSPRLDLRDDIVRI
jgi:Asp-tRNA(Asn)/Glu-tRNA(Gln) amidotransferase C subunit